MIYVCGLTLAGAFQNLSVVRRVEQFFKSKLPAEDVVAMVAVVGESAHLSLTKFQPLLDVDVFRTLTASCKSAGASTLRSTLSNPSRYEQEIRGSTEVDEYFVQVRGSVLHPSWFEAHNQGGEKYTSFAVFSNVFSIFRLLLESRDSAGLSCSRKRKSRAVPEICLSNPTPQTSSNTRVALRGD